MATTFSRLSIINAALLSQGQEALESESDGSLEWATLSANWPTIVEAELQDGEYNYSIVEQELPTSAGAGKFGYDYAYAVPGDALHVNGAWIEDSAGTVTHIDWFHGASQIHTNEASGIWISFIGAIDPEDFSALFAKGIQMKMEAVIARAIKEEHALAQEIEGRAEEMLRRARTASSKEKSPRPFFARGGGRIVNARFRRG